MRTYKDICEEAEGIAKKALEQGIVHYVSISLSKDSTMIFLKMEDDKNYVDCNLYNFLSEEENLNVLDKMIEWINE